jgi:hypothetical protein
MVLVEKGSVEGIDSSAILPKLVEAGDPSIKIGDHQRSLLVLLISSVTNLPRTARE